MHYLLKFGYHGTEFTGYQRGNGSSSVEDSILRIMEKYGISTGFSSAARTDRGVSAAGNVILFRSSMDIGKIAGILNSQLTGMIFHSCAEVDSDFRVRFSSMKHYQYFLPASGIDFHLFSTIMKRFIGEHDFSRFSRRDSRSPVRRVENVSVARRKSFIEVDIKGPNFVWNQIREMIGFAAYHASIGTDPGDPFETVKRKWTAAPAEYLVLMDIEYRNVEFRPVLTRKKKESLEAALEDMKAQVLVMESVMNSTGQQDNVPDQIY